MEKNEFLIYLRSELNQYNLIPGSDSQTKREKKQYINGLMKSSRFFGVSFDELKVVIDDEVKQYANELSISMDEELLDIPTFIRENKRINI